MPAPAARTRSRPWWGPAVLLSAVLAGALVLSANRGSVDVVVIPPQDHVEAQMLADGTPVFVRARADRVEVLDAFTPPGPRTDDGADRLGSTVGWCVSGDRWVDPHLGLTFAPAGARYAGIVPGRMHSAVPAVGLSHREAIPAGDRSAGDPARVGAALDGPPGTIDPPLSGERGHGPPPECRLPQRRLDPVADAPERDEIALSGLLDHGIFAATLRTGRDGWQVATGWLALGPGVQARWCETGRPATGAKARCRGGEAVSVTLGLAAEDVGPVVTSVGAPLLVLMDGGAIVSAAVLPSSTWAGSSLGGTRTVRLSLLGRDRTGSRLLVRPSGDVRCLSAAPLMAGAPAGTEAVYIDADTDIQVGVRTSVAGLSDVDTDAAPGVRVTEVDVVLDDVTCRALAVKSVG